MNKFHFECIDCGRKYKESEVEYLCPSCSKNLDKSKPLVGILRVIYDYNFIKKQILKNKKNFAWSKYLWPLKNMLGLTNVTPLHESEVLRKELDLNKLYLKDDTNLPSCSYKDRASSLVVQIAKLKKKKAVITASTGNAAASLAMISAFENIRSIVLVPSTTRPAKLVQMTVCGASVFPVLGSYDDAFELSLELSEKAGFYNRNTGYNPFTIEGKKSSAFEIWEQLNYKAPDFVIVPTGDGVILSGIAKGFDELKTLGLIKKVPRLIAVQPEHSNSIYLGWKNNNSNPVVLKSANSVADSLVVNAPKCGRCAIKVIRETNGIALTVTDNEILKAISLLGSRSGVFAEPAGASTLAGLIRLKKMKLIKKNDSIVLMITGNGLKDINSAGKSVKLPKSVKNDWKIIYNLI